MLRQKIFNFVRDHPLFARETKELTLDQERNIAVKRMIVGFKEKFFGIEQVLLEELI